MKLTHFYDFLLLQDLRNVLNVKNSQTVEGDSQHTFTFRAALAAAFFKQLHSCLEENI